ncbi:hypothetical protein Ancab_001037 [Ancistrocladus abbreviatus]
MVVSAMAMQNQASSPHSNTLTEVANGIALDAGGQPAAGEANVPKIRKPYTITKQRERWTEEEHKKFLEALKLYGRAWRKIEEHVGSKTAVQIRSHAQKFFSKVTRESNDTTSSIKPIEIPPPRPKRKPMHPYPRKLVLPPKKETPVVDEQPARSTSPKSSISDQEKSPVSVLSAMASDTLGSADSNTPNGSQSPVSSANVTNNNTCLRAEDYAPQEEDMSESTRDEMVSVKLELFPKVDSLVKEGSVEEASTRSVKLFGKTVVVTDAQRPSSSMRTSKPPPLDMGGGLVQAREQNPILANITLGNTENSQSRLPWGVLPPVYYVSTNSDPAESGSTAPMPWWGFYRGAPIPFVSLNTFGSAKESAGCNFEEVQGKENHKEGSWTGSNTESDGNGGKNWDHETQSHSCGPERQQQPDEKLASSRKRAGPEKCVKGFVPYKRCLAMRESQSSATTCDQSEAQRTRLCL